MKNNNSFADSIEILQKNLDKIANVREWGKEMGYEDPKVFSRHFLRHFRERPQKVLNRLRLLSIRYEISSTNKQIQKLPGHIQWQMERHWISL